MENFEFDKKYLFSTTLIRTFENSLLTSNTIEKIIFSESMNKTTEILENSIYSNFINIKEKSNFETMIINRKNWLFEFIEKFCYNGLILSLLRLEYDYHNIKVLLKKRIFKLDNIDSLIDNGTISKEKIQNIFEKEEYNKLSPIMHKGIVTAINNYYLTKQSIVIDLIIDQTQFKELLFISKTISNPFVKKYYKLKIDLINIQTLFRIKEKSINNSIKKFIFLNDGTIEISLLLHLINEPIESIQKTLKFNFPEISNILPKLDNNILEIENKSDEIFLNYLKKTDYLIMGIEPIFAYSQILLIELKTISKLLNAKKAKLDPDTIKEKIINLNLFK